MTILRMCALTAAVACLGATATDQSIASRAEADIRALADRMRRAVEARNAGSVLELVHETGLPGGDASTPRAEVERDLRPGGRLHGYLFDPTQYARESHALDRPMSLVEYFRRARNVKVLVSFDESARGGKDYESGCASYRAENLPFVPQFCFHKVRGRWFITSGLYE